MTAVSNSSPLILFSRIRRLDLIQGLFEEVLVPPAVWREVVTAGTNRPGAREVQHANWIHQRSLPDEEMLRQLSVLDPGEAEAIALAAAQDPRTAVLLDDDRARRIARELGLVVIGSGGLLVLAKNRGFLTSIRPHIVDLRSAGLFLSEAVIRRLLELAGER